VAGPTLLQWTDSSRCKTGVAGRRGDSGCVAWRGARCQGVVVVVDCRVFRGRTRQKSMRKIMHCPSLRWYWLWFVLCTDLADASPTSNAPCSSQRLCQSAHIQNLAGCDAATKSCVCERGYNLDRGVCMGESFKLRFVTFAFAQFFHTVCWVLGRVSTCKKHVETRSVWPSMLPSPFWLATRQQKWRHYMYCRCTFCARTLK